MRSPTRFPLAFSLVEVVIALGVVSFVLVSMLGLLSVGLRNNKESSEQIDAVGVASLLLSTRRAMPTNIISNFAIPPLNASYSATFSSVTISSDGTTLIRSNSPTYQLAYQFGTNNLTGSRLALLRLILWQPAKTSMPTNYPGRYYEVCTQVALP